MIDKMDEGLREFAKRYSYAINDPDLIRRYRMIQDGKRDVASKIEAAMEKAIEKGKARGANEVNRKHAKGMREAGIALDLISKITGLSEAEILAL